MPAWSLISLIYMLLQYNLLPASIGLLGTKHMSSMVGIHVCLMRFIALKGQDVESTGRKQRN